LTAIFEIQVTGISPGGACGAAYCMSFGASTGFATELGGLGFGNTGGAMVAFFEDATTDYTRTGTIAAGEASATGGNPYWLFGLSDTDDFWNAETDIIDISLASLFPPPTTFGFFEAGLSLLDNPFGRNLIDVACADSSGGGVPVLTSNAICGRGGLFAAGTGDFDSWNNVDFTIHAVPEPTTLGLFGLGLFGIGLLGRRRRRQA